MIPDPTIEMGELLPASPTSKRVTGDTQFLFQFYKPCIQFYEPSAQTTISMAKDKLRQSLIAALHVCPLLFGRFKIHKDQSISLEYDPQDSNPPTLEFQDISATYAEFKENSFAYGLAKKYHIDKPIPDGIISESTSKPMLMIKVSYLADGGVAIFSMSNHVAFDGNAIFSFLAHWARCNRVLALQVGEKMVLPPELQVYSTAVVTNTDNVPKHGPVEISVDARKSPAEIGTMLHKKLPANEIRAHVFSISVSNLNRLSETVAKSGILGENEWVSSNNVLAAFVSQCVARASMDAQVYGAGDWTVFQSLDMRRPLQLPLRGLGSPIILAECHATFSEIADPSKFPIIAKRIRQSVNKYTGEYLQDAMDWMSASYRNLARSGVSEPWRHFWFNSLNTNKRAVGLSCMNRIPVYDADFGAGRPTMARSYNPRINYIIVFPGPPTSATRYGSEQPDYDELHLYTTLEAKAMDALLSDAMWNEACTLLSKEF
ncbi:transferase family-domain-containing protein [Coemansia spiralis]|nr:transferase family-domain-containing protein [Coemansia spiralis]